MYKSFNQAKNEHTDKIQFAIQTRKLKRHDLFEDNNNLITGCWVGTGTYSMWRG